MSQGTVTLKYSNDAWQGYIAYTITTNISSNTSTVTAELYMRKNDGHTTGGNGSWAASLTVGSKTVDCTTEKGFSLKQEYVCIGEASTTITHKSDGSATCYLAATVNGPAGTSLAGKTLSGSETIDLDTIPRSSGIDEASNVVLGEHCQITWTPLSSSYYYKIAFSLGGWSHTTGVISPRSTSAYTYSDFIIPLTVANEFPNSYYDVIDVTLSTYSDSSCATKVGTESTAYFYVSVPESMTPTITSCTVSLDNSHSETLASWNVGVAGYSKMNVKAAASGLYGATIESFTISGSYSTTVYGSELDYTGSPIATSGNKSFLITCIDSRGMESAPYETDIISFLPYSDPKITKLTTTKMTNDDEDLNNDRFVVKGSWEMAPIDGHNTSTGKLYYKVTSATDWTEHSGVLENDVAFVVDDFIPDELASYNFKIVVTDALGNSAERDAFQSTVTVLLDFKAGGDGLGIGKICESPGMEVSMDAVFYNEVYIKNRETTLESYIKSLQEQPISNQAIVDLIYPIGSIYMSVNNVNPNVLYGGEWEAIKDTFLLSAGDTFSAGDTGGEIEHALTVDEMPAHQHYGVRRSNNSLSGSGSTGESTGSGDASYYTDSAGGGLSHNNMPPYLVVYVWKRTA